MSYTVTVTTEEGEPAKRREYVIIMYGGMASVLRQMSTVVEKTGNIEPNSIVCIEIHERKTRRKNNPDDIQVHDV